MNIPLKIVTEHIKPPIPVRFFDYQAHIEGHEENRDWYGFGSSLEEAVEDLVEALLGDCETKEDFLRVEAADSEFWQASGGRPC